MRTSRQSRLSEWISPDGETNKDQGLKVITDFGSGFNLEWAGIIEVTVITI